VTFLKKKEENKRKEREKNLCGFASDTHTKITIWYGFYFN
jgi:hypothetical protein